MIHIQFVKGARPYNRNRRNCVYTPSLCDYFGAYYDRIKNEIVVVKQTNPIWTVAFFVHEIGHWLIEKIIRDWDRATIWQNKYEKPWEKFFTFCGY